MYVKNYTLNNASNNKIEDQIKYQRHKQHVSNCMNNMSSIILSHNKRLLRPRTTTYNGCNHQTRENCPYQNQCLMPNLIYLADVENNANKGTKIYFGLSETSFKEQFRNYNKYFNHKQYRKSTELSTYIWLLKEMQIMSRISWSMKKYKVKQIFFGPLYLAEKAL